MIAFAPSRRETPSRVPSSRTRTGSARLGAGDAVRIPLAIGGAITWFVGLRRIDIAELGAGGLFPAIPILAFVGLAVVLATAIGSFTRNWSTPAAVIHVGLLVVALAGVSLVVERVLGYRVAYRHAGVVEQIRSDGSVDSGLDAYFSWPGFFGLLAMLAEVSGVGNVRRIAPWAPLFYNALYSLPLVVLYRQYASSRRHVAVGIVMFTVGNWVFQDYLSPQATAYFVYLSIVVVLLRFFDRPGGEPTRAARVAIDLVRRVVPRDRGRPSTGGIRGRPTALRSERAALGPAQRLALFVIVAIATAALAASHQLTPLVLVLAALALMLVGRCSNPTLVMVIVIIVATWDVFVGAPFLSGNLSSLLREIGNLSLLTDQNLTSRLGGDPAHVRVVRLRMATSGLFALGAVIGWARRRRAGVDDLPLVAVTLAPLLLLPTVSYGGEIIMRVYYFGLPFLAFFAAAAIEQLFDPVARHRLVRGAGGASVVVAGVVLFLVCRFGNQASDSFTPDEFDAIAAMYSVAEPGSTILSLTGNLPWKYQDYADLTYRAIDDNPAVTAGTMAPAAALDGVLTPAIGSGAFLVLSRADIAYAEDFGVLPPASAEAIRAELLRRFAVTIVYESPDSNVYRIDSRRAG